MLEDVVEAWVISLAAGKVTEFRSAVGANATQAPQWLLVPQWPPTKFIVQGG